VWERGLGEGIVQNEMAPANFIDLRTQNRAFEQIGAFVNHSLNLSGQGEPERLEGQRISPAVLSLLGVQPTLGRTLLPEENTPGQHRVVVLSHQLWQRRFNQNPGIVGSQITLDGQPFTVVGVMPRGFFFPERESEFWTPLAMESDEANGRGDHYLHVVARLKPGVSAEQAAAEVTQVFARLASEYPRTNEGLEAFVRPLHDDYVGDLRTPIMILFAAVGLVLLIACANVANLLLSRSTSRQREMAIRTALGAKRWRIVRQLLTESFILAFLGGLVGVAIGIWGVAFLSGLVPETLSQIQGVSINARTLVFTLGVTVSTAVVFGIAPALQASKIQPGEALKEGDRSGRSMRGRRARSVLVVSEVALALIVLVGAGLLIRTFQRLRQVETGFQASNLLTMRTVLPPSKYPSPDHRRAFYNDVLRRVQELPGVEAAGVISFLPLSFKGISFSFTVEGRSASSSDLDLPMAVYRVISPDYFRTMGIPTLRGRAFENNDTADRAPVVVVNRSLADHFWPGEEAVGKRLKVGPADSPNPWTTVVGVVGNVRQVGLQGEQKLEMYAPYMQDRRGFIAPRDLVVRTKANAASMAGAIRAAVWAVDKDQPISSVRTMEQVYAVAVSRERFNALLLSLFAGLALVLALVGLYGVTSYAVTQRTHEIGVRMALGAQQGEVLRLIIKQGMALTFLGVALGLGVAVAVTRLMTGILYGVTATDPITFAGVAILLAVVAFLACYIPARRATKVDPLVALRYE
jgi:putative ABC transport system permease protein